MIPCYSTNVPAYRPLMKLLDGVLMTPKEVAAHLRYSPEQLSNLRRSAKGPPWIKLPSGGVRYDLSALMEWQLSGSKGSLSVDRVTLAVLACASVPIEHRAAIVAHLERAFTPSRGDGADEVDAPGVVSRAAPALALIEEATAGLEEAKAELAEMKAGLLQPLATTGKRKRGRPSRSW